MPLATATPLSPEHPKSIILKSHSSLFSMNTLQPREIIGSQFGDNARIHQGDVLNHIHNSPDDETAKCLSDLRITDPQHDKVRIENTKGGLLKDSYRWILDHSDFQQWRHDECNRLLWIKGDPGKGKTMLLCGIIDELGSQHDEETLVSYFFCQATDSRINSATAVLRGLIYMAIKQQPLLISHIQEKYKDGGKTLFQDINAWTALSEIFSNILNDTSLKQVIIIIDALDECITDLPMLLNFISTSTNSAVCSRVKWMVSSRNWPEIQDHLNSADQQIRLCLELNDTSISTAVDIYIKHRVKQLARRKGYKPKLENTIQNYLSTHSNNTFLWVALVCENLEKIPLRRTLQMLHELPPGLDSVYNRMMKQIHHLVAVDAKFSYHILAVVLLVYRPITIAELGCLVKSLDSNLADADLDSDLEDANLIHEAIGFCGSFLTIRGEQIFIIHQSAKDYLTKEMPTVLQSSFADIHGIIFTQSVNAMSAMLRRNLYNLDPLGLPIDQIEAPDPDPLKSLYYSCTHWANHFCDIYSNNDQSPHEVGDKESQLALQFIQNYFLYWLEALGLIKCVEDGVLSIIRLESLLKGKTIHTQFREPTPYIQRSYSLRILKKPFKEKPPVRQSPDHRQSSNYQLLKLVQDSRRFIQQNSSVIAGNPLQAYASALIFTPSNSLIRNLFKNQEPKWLKLKPMVDYDWTPGLLTLEGHRREVFSVAFSADGYLASGSRDQTIKIWDIITGKERQTLKGHTKSVNSVAFSSDGHLASGSDDGTIMIWDITTGKSLQALGDHDDWITSIAFSSNGSLASGSVDGTITIWDITTGKELRTLEGHSDWIESITFSPDGYLASGARDNTIKIWDIIIGTERQSLEGHNSWISSLAFSADGRYLASGSRDATIKIWDSKTGKELQTVADNSLHIHSIVFSTDSRYLAAAIYRTIKIWDITTGKEHQTLPDRDEILSIAFSPDGRYLASGLHNHTIHIWDLTIADEQQAFEDHGEFINIALSADGRYLASGSEEKIIKTWDTTKTTTGNEQQLLRGHSGMIESIAFSADGRYLASASADTTTKIWDIIKGKELKTCRGHINDVWCVTFSADSRYLASGSAGMIKIWDAATGEEQHTFVGDGEMGRLIAFSADSHYLAAGPANIHVPEESDDMAIKLWDITTGKELQTFKGHNDWITAIAFSADGRYLASASEDLTLRIWDIVTGNEIRWIEIVSELWTLSFDSTASYLHTQIGPITLDMEHQPTITAQVKSPDTTSAQGQNQHQLVASNTKKTDYFGYALSPDGCWITWSGRGILWLPPEYRPSTFAMWPSLPFTFSQPLSTDTVIALASYSGRIAIMRMPGGTPYSTL